MIADSRRSDVGTGLRTQRWAVAAPFIRTPHDRWLSEWVPEAGFSFVKVPRTGEEGNWHQRRTQGVPVGEWARCFRQAHEALRVGTDGVVTIFPQVALAVSAEKRLRRLDVPLLAWFFNTDLGSGMRLRAARAALQGVDRFVVHSTREIGIYSRQLRLPEDRFAFVHLQHGGEVADDDEDRDDPFVFATGSGFRDYGTFFEAIERLGHRTLVLAGPRVLHGLTPPPSVTILDQLPKAEIRSLVRRARVNVIPMNGEGANGGLATMVEAFRHGRGVVVTDRPGVDDYVMPGVNSLTHAIRDARGLADAIEAFWTDDGLREKLNAGALEFAEEHLTDAAAGRSLGRHLVELGRR